MEVAPLPCENMSCRVYWLELLVLGLSVSLNVKPEVRSWPAALVCKLNINDATNRNKAAKNGSILLLNSILGSLIGLVKEN